jgi:hypothetical protein
MIFSFFEKKDIQKANILIFSLYMVLIGVPQAVLTKPCLLLVSSNPGKPRYCGEAVGDALNRWGKTHRQEAIFFKRILSSAPHTTFAFFSKEISLNILSPAAERFFVKHFGSKNCLTLVKDSRQNIKDS